MKIQELMDGIRKLDLVLPEFQREYVWQREQAKQLMVSLLRSYPTGSLLFWKTDNPPDVKNSTISPGKLGTTLVILDGQQRLTTLYLLTQGDIPPYYEDADILTDPRSLYFDLASGEFQFYQASRMSGNPTWRAVTDCFGGKPINVFDIAKRMVVEGDDPFSLAQRYNDHLTRLRNIMEREYPIQTVPPSAGIDDAIDVFDRVNSLGTKLSDAELALAHITAKWPPARKVMKDKITALEGQRYRFGLTFMVRALTAVAKGRALFETIHETPKDELLAAWEKLSKILDYLVGLLPGQAHVDSTADLNTTNVLVPAVAYLARSDGAFATDVELRQFIHWLYAASLWGRYTSQTDNRMDHDISIINQSPAPWAQLVDAIIEQRGRIEVKSADLEGRIIQHPLYRAMFVMAKSRGAIDWFNGSHLAAAYGDAYAIHSHHIFPQALLYGPGGYDGDNHLHKKLVNEIANRAFLTSDTNLHLAARPPAEYLPEIEERYPGALAKQFIPTDPALWKLERYEDFLEARRRLIADAINEQMDALLAELDIGADPDLGDLLVAGESPVLEYKSSLRWDLRTQQVNKELSKVVAKTVAGLMNFEGGISLIGVADNGSVLGIEHDFATLRPSNRDGFEQALVACLAQHLGDEFLQYVKMRFEDHPDGTVCRVTVEPSPKPVYVLDKDKVEFYVRAGNTTRPLDVQATHDYITMHWET